MGVKTSPQGALTLVSADPKKRGGIFHPFKSKCCFALPVSHPFRARGCHASCQNRKFSDSESAVACILVIFGLCCDDQKKNPSGHNITVKIQDSSLAASQTQAAL